MNLFPQKGRSEGDASTKLIASFTALTTRNPRRNKIYSHMSSIIPGKEFNQKQVTNLEMKQQTSKPEPVLSKKRRKKTKTHSPQLQMFIVLHIQNHIPQATNRQVNKLYHQVG